MSVRLTLPSRVVAALAAYLCVAGLVSLAAQPPEVEDPKAKVKKKIGVEDEDPKGTIKKKVIVDDPDPPVTPKTPVGPGGNTPDKRLDELDRAATEAKVPAIKKMLASYAVPFDRLIEKSDTLRIRPFGLLWGKDDFPLKKSFAVTPIEGAGKSLDDRQVNVADIKKIEPFEMAALAEVEAWLKQKPVGTGPGPDDLTGEDQLAAAEKLLSAASRFHEYARENGIRKGK